MTMRVGDLLKGAIQQELAQAMTMSLLRPQDDDAIFTHLLLIARLALSLTVVSAAKGEDDVISEILDRLHVQIDEECALLSKTAKEDKAFARYHEARGR